MAKKIEISAKKKSKNEFLVNLFGTECTEGVIKNIVLEISVKYAGTKVTFSGEQIKNVPVYRSYFNETEWDACPKEIKVFNLKTKKRAKLFSIYNRVVEFILKENESTLGVEESCAEQGHLSSF